jgi:hypothetical protein
MFYVKTQNPTSKENGVLIFGPWQPLGYGLFLWTPFYVALLNYNKRKCNKKPLECVTRGLIKGG